LDHSQRSGVFSEQINTHDGGPLSVSPLVWNYAEYITSLDELSESKNNGKCK